MLKILRAALGTPLDVWQAIVTYWPGPAGYLLRNRFWRKQLDHLGSDVRIDVGTYFQNPRYISLGDRCWIDRGVMLLGGPDRSTRRRLIIENKNFPLARGDLHIGRGVHVGPYSIISGIGGVYISDDCGLASGFKAFSFSHHYRSEEDPTDRSFLFALPVPHEQQFMIEGPIFFDRNVGAGSNAIVLPGVSIGQDSFVTINSVVNRSFEENSFIVGNPGRRIRTRYETTADTS